LNHHIFPRQAEDAREKAAAAAAEAAALAAQAKALGREARIGRELRDENYRLEEALQKCARIPQFDPLVSKAYAYIENLKPQ